jgi:hypothetical protein
MKRGTRRDAEDVETLVARIATMRLDALRTMWAEHLGVPPPGQSTEILRRRLAWELQARTYGGLSAETKRRLRQLHDRFTRDPTFTPSPILDLKPGTVLLREWNGARHQVRVLHDGFEYGGQRYGSLSEIARAITGQRWSGPLFFGLKRPSGMKKR